MRFVDRFTPSFYPATYSTVCVSITKQEVGGTLDGFDFSILAYRRRRPGRRARHIARQPAGARGDVAGLRVRRAGRIHRRRRLRRSRSTSRAAASISARNGIRRSTSAFSSGWTRTAPAVRRAAATRISTEHSWDSLFFTFPDYTALLIRAIERSPTPRACARCERRSRSPITARRTHRSRTASSNPAKRWTSACRCSRAPAISPTCTRRSRRLRRPASPTSMPMPRSAISPTARARTRHFRIRMDAGSRCFSAFALPISISADQGSFAPRFDIAVGERAVDVVPHGLPLKTELAGTTSVIHVPQSASL